MGLERLLDPNKKADSGTPKDCLECKIVGVTTLSLSGLYVLYHRQSIPASQKLGRIGAAAFGCGLLTLGVIRGAM